MSKTTKEWISIYKVISEHLPYPSKSVGESLCFNSVENCFMCQDEGINHQEVNRCPHIDYDEYTNKKLVVKCEQYNLIKDENNLNMIEEVDEEEYFENKLNKEMENGLIEEDKKEEEDLKYLSSKNDRNTVVSQIDKFEEDKEDPYAFTRSVNEYSSK